MGKLEIRINRWLGFLFTNKQNTLTETERMDFEQCCICGKTTAVRLDTPICQRRGYMEGAGQLCMDCYHDILFPGKNEEQEENIHRRLK